MQYSKQLFNGMWIKDKRHIRYLFVSLLLVIVNFASSIEAQEKLSIENLEKKIKTFSPKEKASVYLQCYDKLIFQDLTEAAKYNQKALEISLENGLLLEQAFCYYNLGYMDRIKSNNLKGIENFKHSIRLFEKVDNKIALSQCYNNIGIIYKNTNELKKAMLYYMKALEIAETIKYKIGIVDIISNIAVIYLKQEEYKQAIVYLEKSLAIQESRDHAIINNLGAAHKALGNNNKALKYYKESYSICKQKMDFQSQANPLNNMGTIYLFQKKYDKALDCFIRVEEIEKKLNLNEDLISTHVNIGLVYRMKKDYPTSLKYLGKAMLIAEQTPGNKILKNIYMSLALTYEDYGKHVLAIDYLYRYINLNKELFDLDKNKQIQELLAKFEAKSKEKELVLLRKDKELKDIELRNNHADLERQKLYRELETKENATKILLLKKQNELQTLTLQKNEIETEKKEKEIIYLTKETEIQKLKFEKRQDELKQKNVLKNIAIISAGFIILTAIILIIIYQQKLRTVELLNIKTEEVNKQKIYELLRDQEFSSIKANVEGQEKERKRIAQDLHDGIGGNLASIKLNLVNIIKDNKNEKLVKVMRNIDDTYNEVRSISHNLVPAKIMNQAFIKLIQNFINEILNRKLLAVKFTAFPENELNLLSNEIKIEIYRVIQELMNNIVKYSKAKNVEIQLIMRDEHVNLMVEDDGVGFDTSSQAVGIGLSNIRSRIHEIKGDVNIESSIGNWTLVNIEIPIENKVEIEA